MPINVRPATYKTIWPAMAQEAVDFFATRVDGDAVAMEAERNRVRAVPSGQDIWRMEQAIAWPARYLVDRAVLRLVVLRVAAGQARYRPLERIAHQMKRRPFYVRRCNRAGLDLIAEGLRRDKLAVF
jgi:hypothetical protein